MIEIMSIKSAGRKGMICFPITGVPEKLSNGDTFRLTLFGTVPGQGSCVDLKRRHWAAESGRNECILSCWAGDDLFDHLLKQGAKKDELDPNAYILPSQVWG